MTRHGRPAWLIGLMVISLVPLVAAAPSQGRSTGAAEGQVVSAAATVAVEDCWGIALPEGARDVDCFFVEVPLDHDEPEGETIRIATARIRAESDTPAEPVLVLGGGPGERIVRPLTALVAALPQAVVDVTAVDRDIVLIDQRGVGLSEPALDCPEAAQLQLTQPLTSPQLTQGLWPFDIRDLATSEQVRAQATGNPLVDAYAACYERLSAEVDLSAFTTLQNVADLDWVRQALVGDGQIALYGGSYGARLALRAQGAFPDSWSAVVLTSPVPGDGNWVQDLPRNYQDTLDRLAAACTADATGCANAFPGLLADLDQAVLRLSQEPVQVTVPTAAEPLVIPIDGVTLANLLFSLLYLPPRPVPAVIDAFADGREQAALVGSVSPGPRVPTTPFTADQDAPEEPEFAFPVSLGMQRSFLCAEEFAYADLERQAADTAASSLTVQTFMQAPAFGALGPEICEVWDVPAADPSTFAPVASDIPTLVVTGGLDPITPPRYGHETMAGLSQGVLVEASDQGHSASFALAECGARLVGAFLADPAGDLDTSCVDDRRLFFDTVLSDAPALSVSRVGGADRYETAARLSGWTFDPGVDVAFLATGDNFPDGLAAGAGGAQLGGPVLLTRPGSLPAVTAAELARLQPGRVVIVGGLDAVNGAVHTQASLAAQAPVARAAGSDRYGTAAALSRELHPDGTSTAFVATGQAFPDALTASAVAGAGAAPVLLTASDHLPDSTREELARLAAQDVIVVGGEQAIAPAVLAEIEELGVSVTRLAGADRYATAAAVAAQAGAGTGWAFTATGTAFPDVLAGAPVAAGRGPLLLVRPDGIPAVTGGALQALGPLAIGVFGGPNAVSEAVAADLAAFIGQGG